MKIICISDTHGEEVNVPKGEVLIHAGDFSRRGSIRELENFCWQLKHWKEIGEYKYIITICGNHDFVGEKMPELTKRKIEETGAIYLNDSGCSIHNSEGKEFKVWGSPVQPELHNWAFNRKRGKEIKKHWNLIPPQCDILITHGPPYGYGDMVKDSLNPEHLGCEELRKKIEALPDLKYHIFGHIHSGNKISQRGNTTLINASILNEAYFQEYKPVIIE